MFEYPTINGGENSLLAMAEQLSQLGVQFQAAGPPTGPLADRLQQQGIPILPLDLIDAAGSRHELGECRRRIDALLANASYDVVHSNSLSMSRIVGPVVRQRDVPSLGHIRDIVNISRRATTDVDLNCRVLSVSEATREHHCRAGLTPEKTFVLYNGVDLDKFQPRPPSFVLHRELGIPDTCPIVVSIGQVVLRKGLDTLLSAAFDVAAHFAAHFAAPQARTGDCQPHFVHVGARYSVKQEAIEHELELRRLSESDELSGRFHFLGARSDVRQILADSTLLVHTAKQEPLGRVLLEAAACGLPIIATAVGGTCEILPTAESGAVVPVNEPAAVAREIVELLEDRTRRESMGAAARIVAEQNFDVRMRASELLGHYKAVANI
ncbi:MAG: glycosyltransferase involved in cell wall biosynthesis [Pirellulaceae bacterium]|jgi:glycosyltransferase involved in cell wall biosynthesis